MQDLTLGILTEFSERQRLVPLNKLVFGLNKLRPFNPTRKQAARDQRRALAKLQQLCIDCVLRPRVNRSHCAECEARRAERRKAKFKAGMCAQCGARPRGKTSRCDPCAAKRRARAQ